MTRRRTPQRFTAWIAIFAMLASALVPTLSRAMGPAGDAAAWVEVCTFAGLQRIALPAGEGDPADAPAPGLAADCPYCVSAAGGFALPPGQAPALFLPAGGDVSPPIAVLPLRTASFWPAAHPRAPPAFS